MSRSAHLVKLDSKLEFANKILEKQN